MRVRLKYPGRLEPLREKPVELVECERQVARPAKPVIVVGAGSHAQVYSFLQRPPSRSVGLENMAISISEPQIRIDAEMPTDDQAISQTNEFNCSFSAARMFELIDAGAAHRISRER